MSFDVFVTPQAEEQLRDAVTWRRQNRPAAPDLLAEEFERTIEMLRAMPDLGPRFPRTAVPGVRRILLRRSRYWIYYVSDPSRGRVYVLAVWSGHRGSAPALGD